MGARQAAPGGPERGHGKQVVSGIVALNGTVMRAGAALTREVALTLEAETEAEVLLIDLA